MSVHFRFKDRKLIFWLVSHCGTGIKREEYVEKLKEFVDVDIYGKCTNNECSKKGNECFENLSKDYMFYLAFENSICDEYATEKFFRFDCGTWNKVVPKRIFQYWVSGRRL